MLHHQNLHHIILQWISQSRISVWFKCFKQYTGMISVNQNLLELVPCWNVMKFHVKTRSSLKMLKEKPPRKRIIMFPHCYFVIQTSCCRITRSRPFQDWWGSKKRFMKNNRFGFDCSTGRSIHKELLSEPDLTNQITGVLTRFREVKVAFMANVEAMFNQVQVPDDQLSFVKLLWWENHDIDRKPMTM